jgi:hypothetical protein
LQHIDNVSRLHGIEKKGARGIGRYFEHGAEWAFDRGASIMSRISRQPLPTIICEVNATATPGGFALTPFGARQIVILAQIVEDEHASVLAFLADGESWSSSALAMALNASQRTVQRALDSLAEAGKVQSFGQGRARRWMTPPVPGFTTTLLLPAPLPDG